MRCYFALGTSVWSHFNVLPRMRGASRPVCPSCLVKLRAPDRVEQKQESGCCSALKVLDPSERSGSRDEVFRALS